MASSSHFGNFIGKEIVDDAPNHQTENDEALHQDRGQSPVVITLMKKSRTAEDKDQELSFKLPNGWFTDLFIMVEVQNSLGFTKNILWSKPINFTLPDDCVERILGLDEEMKTTRGADCLSLLERLEGWTVERRPRDYLGIYDNSLQFFYHNKAGRFRSFIEVEAYIIHSKFPKDRKPKESSSVVKPSGSASIQKTSVKRETSPKNCSNITEKKRLQAEKFLYEAWRNFSDNSMLEDVPISSTNVDEEQVMQILNEARNNLLDGFSSKTDQTETLDNDADEELAQLIADLHQAMQ